MLAPDIHNLTGGDLAGILPCLAECADAHQQHAKEVGAHPASLGGLEEVFMSEKPRSQMEVSMAMQPMMATRSRMLYNEVGDSLSVFG